MGNGSKSGLLKGIRNTGKAVGMKLTRFIGDTIANANHLSEMYLHHTNPHRDDYLNAENKEERARLKREYRENCQRAAMALDLRLAGNDVEALKNPGDDAGWFSDFNNISYKKFYENANWHQITSTNSIDARNEIAKLLSTPGARAVVRIRWDNGGGHVWNIVNSGGKLIGLDGQTNSVFDPSKYLDRGRYTGNDYGSMHILVTNKGGNTSDLYKINKNLEHLYIKPRKR